MCIRSTRSRGLASSPRASGAATAASTSVPHARPLLLQQPVRRLPGVRPGDQLDLRRVVPTAAFDPRGAAAVLQPSTRHLRKLLRFATSTAPAGAPFDWSEPSAARDGSRGEFRGSRLLPPRGEESPRARPPRYRLRGPRRGGRGCPGLGFRVNGRTINEVWIAHPRAEGSSPGRKGDIETRAPVAGRSRRASLSTRSGSGTSRWGARRERLGARWNVW